MKPLRLFTDGSVNPKSKTGYGAYLAVPEDTPFSDSFKAEVIVKKFEKTSSTKLEIQTLIWALTLVQHVAEKFIIYTDSQNIMGLHARKERLEKKNYRSKKNKLIKNAELYQVFYRLTDQLDCTFIKVKGHQASHKKEETEKFFTLVDRASRKSLRRGEPPSFQGIKAQ